MSQFFGILEGFKCCEKKEKGERGMEIQIGWR